jgi:hypothetical protein
LGAVEGEDAYVASGDEENDAPAFVGGADSDVGRRPRYRTVTLPTLEILSWRTR